MTDDPLIGQHLDEYEVLALLGQGGMARVYRGLDTRLKRYVAIKVIDASFRADSDYAMRFEREAQAIAQLDHPHIVQLYRYGEAPGVLYMAMQYLEGADLGFVLTSYHNDNAFIQPEDARRIIKEVCLALDYAHGKGVIHRDVKPSNIMLDKQGRAILTDFGLALLTEIGTRGEIIGSPHYIAPEQAISSAKSVPQSDLYAVGVILYEMFTGQLPFTAEEPMDVALLHISEPPRPPREIRADISPELEAVILKCLEKEPTERYPDGAALSKALDEALKKKSIPLVASLLTIPNRVALGAEAYPLPPLPAAVTETPLPLVVPAPSPAASLPIIKRPLMLIGMGVGALIGLVLVASLCGVLLNQFSAKPNTQTSATQTVIAATQITLLGTPAAGSTPGAVFLPLINTAGTSEASPTSTPETLPSPTPISANYTLRLFKSADGDNLILINASSAAFPLASLRLGDGKNAIHGTDWGVAQLASGECVGVGKGSGANLPNGVTCEVVGAQFERGGKNRFWRETFAIYYNNVVLVTCEKNPSECTIQIQP